MQHALLVLCLSLTMAAVWRLTCVPQCMQGNVNSQRSRLLARLGNSCAQLPVYRQASSVKGFNQDLVIVRARNGFGSSSDSGSSSVPEDGGDQDHKQKKRVAGKGIYVLKVVFLGLLAALQAALAVVLLFAALPYLLSSRWGTKAASAAASRMLPGDVHIRRIRLGWTQPVTIEGVAVYEAASNSRQLLGLERFSSAEPLYDVVTGSRGLTLTLSNPSIDCSLDETGETLRLLKYLEGSRVWGIIKGRHTAATTAAATVAGPHAKLSSSSSSSSSIHSHPIKITAADETAVQTAYTSGASESFVEAEASAGAAAAAAEAAARQAASTSSSSSSSGGQVGSSNAAAPAAAPAAAAVLPAGLLHRLTQSDSSARFSAELRLPRLSLYVPDGRLLLPNELRAAMGDHIHAVAAAGPASVQELADELEEDASWLHQQQYQQPQQQLQTQLQPQQQKHQLPPALPAEANHDRLQQRSEPASEFQKQQDQQDVSTVGESSGQADWLIPPNNVSQKSWKQAMPVLLQVSGDRVSALVRGWHIGSLWRLRDSKFLMQQPAMAAWEFTPELAALTLSQFNPLLDDVVRIKEGAELTTSFAPADGQLPAERGQLLVSPVKVVVGKGALISQVYKLLGLHAKGSSSSSSSHQLPWLKGISSSAEQAAAAADDDDAGSNSVRGVEVWSGPLRVTMEGPGRYMTNRVDMILGSGRTSLHLALWGTVDTTNNRLAMTVGLPASTLAKAGIKHLPHSYVLPISVSGQLQKPQIEWNAAVRQLAVLSAMQLGRQAWRHEQNKAMEHLWSAATHHQRQGPGGLASGLAGLLGAANRVLSDATSSFIGQVDERLQQELCEVPPPTADLPWQQQHTHYHQHKNTQQQQQRQQEEEEEELSAADDSGASETTTEAAQRLHQQHRGKP